jgi:hypothetical protein
MTGQLELFSHSLKRLNSIQVNFSIFPGEHNHHIWTSFNHSCQFWRLEREQIPTFNITKAIWRCPSRRMVYNSARDCLKLVRVHFKKNCWCTEGERWANTMLIKKRVQYVRCFYYFLQSLYFLGLTAH